MDILNSATYTASLKSIANTKIIEELNNKTLFITGASGMICSCLIDAIMMYNEIKHANCKIIAVVRNVEYAKIRFRKYIDDDNFSLLNHDVTQKFTIENSGVDYYIHAASNTHPVAYANEPINTILSNIFGLNNVLELAVKSPHSRTLFVSSVEIYGNNRGDAKYFDETYCGYIDCNTLRAGYPEAKRLSEALCNAYIKEKSADTVVLRLPRSYGPTVKVNDSRAISQFISKGINNENIVLKSKGTQLFSYAYVFDEILGILYALIKGERGEAYNLADSASDIMMKDLAEYIADICNTQVIYDIPSDAEKLGASTTQLSLMNADKLKELGWKPNYTIKSGLKETFQVLKEI